MSSHLVVLVASLVAVLSWAGPRPRVPTRGTQTRRRATGVSAPLLSSALLLTASQLRAGASPTEAWRRALGPGVEVVDDVPSMEHLRGPGGRRSRADDESRAAAVVVAAGAARALGAPLAGVLERVAVSVAADEESVGELHAALAGPRATARVLSWLPVLGLAVSTLLGADPLAVMLSGGLGSLAACLGLGLLLLGRLWTRAMLTRATGSRPAASRRNGGSAWSRRSGSAW